ncbi:FAD-dependent monooxygenase [Streptomyces sp. NBC_01619]|uniref:FAD-dependent monooxygenase n=1 Tax=Streptomyces pratisoli TaxID=3139917 RepID=A0ACC6QI84_9ACTN|nr:FAD-dependent monooxygenase [Streptomyces sp. NBC_01619]MCX4511520.1 FAD-dependent monooxygenase [Streptomyces sp. NBC_01619]
MKTNTPPRQRALVVGLGITGTASALRLHKAGWDVVVLEKAAERRRGGYFLCLFGTGITAAERLGIEVPDRSSADIAYYNVDRAGRRRRCLGFTEAVPGRSRPVVRGDVETAAFDALSEDVEIRYSSIPVALRQDAEGVQVDIEDTATGTAATERFDLVVGADGLRSTVRRLAFGPDESRIHRLGYMLAACSLPGPVPGFRGKDGIVMAELGRSAWVFAFADRPPTVLFNYRTNDVDGEFTRPAIDSLRAVFGPEPTGATLGWLLDRFEQAPDHLFDTAEQVRLDTWHQGRVVLVGDAAWCLTLYSGMGASTGLAGADMLGTMLERYPGDVPRALRAWEVKLRPFIEFHQGTGMAMRQLFLPADRTEYRIRSVMDRVVATTLGRRLLSEREHRSKAARMKTVDIALA